MDTQDQVAIKSTRGKTARLERSAQGRGWPDDGLPARHREGSPGGSLHPAAVLADLVLR